MKCSILLLHITSLEVSGCTARSASLKSGNEEQDHLISTIVKVILRKPCDSIRRKRTGALLLMYQVGQAEVKFILGVVRRQMIDW